jgi:hypothetical protein
VVPPSTTGVEATRAAVIASALGAEVLRSEPDRISDLYLFSGQAARLLAIADLSRELVAFYVQPVATPPPRPWLVARVDVAPRRLGDVGAEVLQYVDGQQASDAVARIVQRLGGIGEVTATVYTPEREPDGDGLAVEVWTTERVVWRGRVDSPHRGHVLVIEVPDTVPDGLRAPVQRPDDPPLCAALAELMVDVAAADIDLAGRRVVLGLSPGAIVPRSTAARVALTALARSHVVRLRQPEGEAAPVLSLSCLEPDLGLDLGRLPLLRTVAGETMSVAEALAGTRRTCGLLYGTVDGVPADLDGLDRTRILELDDHAERLLIALCGEASYVRVDARETLASHRGVRVRDIAVGLRGHEDPPLPVEGDMTGWSDAERETCERALVDQLVARYRAHDPVRRCFSTSKAGHGRPARCSRPYDGRAVARSIWAGHSERWSSVFWRRQSKGRKVATLPTVRPRTCRHWWRMRSWPPRSRPTGTCDRRSTSTRWRRTRATIPIPRSSSPRHSTPRAFAERSECRLGR